MAFICNSGYGLLSLDIEEPPDDVRPDAQNLSDEYDDLDLKLEEFVRFENMLLVDERKRASLVSWQISYRDLFLDFQILCEFKI
jgi:hypothetical protein